MYATRYQARKANPSATIICKVDGGFIAFAHWTDYKVWRGQK